VKEKKPHTNNKMQNELPNEAMKGNNVTERPTEKQKISTLDGKLMIIW